METATEQAIDHCIRENILKDFLIEQRVEMTKVMTMDCSFEKRLEFCWAESVDTIRPLYEQVKKEMGDEF